MIITIDGPSGSGKSTIGRLLAKRLGYYYVYSGLVFRALAYLLINHRMYDEEKLKGVVPDDVDVYLDPKRFAYQYDDKFQERVFFDGQDITPFLEDKFIAKGASILGENEYVRKKITDLQRQLATQYDLVVDGRDSGSHVFPKAPIKFYLTAPLEVRAQRWIEKQKKEGRDYTEKEAQEIIQARDKRDEKRAIAPLVIPEDAIIVDTSDKTVEQTLDHLLTMIHRDTLLIEKK